MTEIPVDNNTKVEKFFAEATIPGSIPSWERIQQGDSNATGVFLQEISPTIAKAVNAYANGDKLYNTQARIMAIEAAKTYDPNKGASIETYVYGQLRPLQRLAAQRGNLTRVPENVAQQRSVVMRAIRELTADLGEDPTTEQIADRVGMSRKRVDALLNYRPVVPDSVAVNPEGDAIHAESVDKTLELYDEVIYNELDNIDKKIYEWSTGYGKGERLSGKEIASRLNITPAAVSKRYAKIVQKFGEDRELIRRTISGQRIS
jgi:DNA-directed RNA polymerase specialized sigma subunit